MSAFFLELFSEEIPARMQARAAEDLGRLLVEALAPLAPTRVQTWHGPGAFTVTTAEAWASDLVDRRVLVDAEARKTAIRDGVARLAAAKGLTVVEDPGLVDEVEGLVEWPVPLLGRLMRSSNELP
jgi:glycyl-tRNA synthetase beta subunit